MKRTSFKPRRAVPAPDTREQRLVERAARAMAEVRPRAAVVAVVHGAPAAPVVKDKPIRSEPYRRAVASLPCAYCGIAGYSQHAHENDGKGKGAKVDDRRAMPLCCARPGVEGCHVPFDQYRLLAGGRAAHHAVGAAWSKQTRQTIHRSGLWPKSLPLWQENEQGGSNASQ